MDDFDRVSRLAELVCTPRGATAMCRWRPFSVAAFRLVRGLAAEGLRFQTVIDVGANVGKFARAALGMWPDSTVLAFEALPVAVAGLRSHTAWAHRVEIFPVALGASDGTIPFYPHDYSLSSSPLPVPADLQLQHEWARESDPIQVAVRRLDGVVAQRNLQRPLLIKLDVQGYELEVLKGARETLTKADALVLEQSFDTIYQGQPLFPECNRFLDAAGWDLVRPLDWRRDRGRVTEVDSLYLPRP